MCGFVGILGPEFAERSALLRRMLDTIAHRGPDGEGIHEDPHIALGHRRLAIFDTSDAAAQPMTHPDSGHVLAFNGALYNHPELRADLPDAPRSSGDTEVMLRHLVRRGDAALDDFNGMWAFALWDPRQRTLRLSRDRLGVKPLYWRHWNRHLAFASEPQALLVLTPDAPRMDADALGTFLLDRTLDHGAHTLFADIHQLPPASVVQIDATHPTATPTPHLYWRPDAHTTAPCPDPGPDPSPDTARETELAALLDDAVRLRLRADVSVGFLVSGGLDSSSILAAAARQARSANLRAYTLRYDDARDESRQARAIVDHINRDPATHPGRVDLSFIEPARQNLGDALDHLLKVQGEPFADGSMLAHYLLMQAVAADGHKVVIGGLGGDEALGGYIGPYARARAADQLLQGCLRAASHTLGGLRQLPRCLPHLPPAGLRNRLRRGMQARQLSGWVRPELMTHVTDRYRDERGSDRFHSYLLGGLRQWALPGFTHYEDRNAMHFGLEARAPLLDYRIIEWGLSQPPERLIANGLGKVALRHAMHGRLPQAVLWHPRKQGLPAPADTWMAANADWVDAALAGAHTLDAWLDTAAIRRDYHRALASGTPLGHALGASRTDVLWRVLTTARWSTLFGVRA